MCIVYILNLSFNIFWSPVEKWEGPIKIRSVSPSSVHYGLSQKSRQGLFRNLAWMKLCKKKSMNFLFLPVFSKKNILVPDFFILVCIRHLHPPIKHSPICRGHHGECSVLQSGMMMMMRCAISLRADIADEEFAQIIYCSTFIAQLLLFLF